jgi:hypothetical protein
VQLGKVEKDLGADSLDDVGRVSLEADRLRLKEKEAILFMGQQLAGSEWGRVGRMLQQPFEAARAAAAVEQFEYTGRIATAARKAVVDADRNGKLSANGRERLTTLRSVVASRINRTADDSPDLAKLYRAEVKADEKGAVREFDRQMGVYERAEVKAAGEAGRVTESSETLVQRVAKENNSSVEEVRKLLTEWNDQSLRNSGRSLDEQIGVFQEIVRDNPSDMIYKARLAMLQEALEKEARKLSDDLIGEDYAASRAFDREIRAGEEAELAAARTAQRDASKATQKEIQEAERAGRQVQKDELKDFDLTMRATEWLDRETAKRVIANVDRLLKADGSQPMRQYANQLLRDLEKVSKASGEVVGAYRERMNKQAVRGLLTEAQKAQGPAARAAYMKQYAEQFARVDWENPRAAQQFLSMMKKPSGWEKAHGARIAGLLAGPPSLALQAVGHLLETTAYIPGTRAGVRSRKPPRHSSSRRGPRCAS